MVTIDTMLADARRELQRVTAAQAHAAHARGAWLIDVRTWEQRLTQGEVPGAVTISLNVLEWRLAPDSTARLDPAPATDELVMVLCFEGYSSSLAAARLQALGFASATDVIDGFVAWRAAGLPVTTASTVDVATADLPFVYAGVLRAPTRFG
jgi:rhodanese-related sulfurtransferase